MLFTNYSKMTIPYLFILRSIYSLGIHEKYPDNYHNEFLQSLGKTADSILLYFNCFGMSKCLLRGYSLTNVDIVNSFRNFGVSMEKRKEPNLDLRMLIINWCSQECKGIWSHTRAVFASCLHCSENNEEIPRVPDGEEPCWRKQKLSPKDVRWILRDVNLNPRTTSQAMLIDLRNSSIKISQSTLQRT